MTLTASDIFIITVATILTLITIILVIWEAEKQMYEFGLRPSESTSADMAGLMTLARGISGNVENIKYENVTKNVIYNITIKNKLVCVESIARYTSTDCSSSAFDSKDELSLQDVTGFEFKINKNDMNELTLLLTKFRGIYGMGSVG